MIDVSKMPAADQALIARIGEVGTELRTLLVCARRMRLDGQGVSETDLMFLEDRSLAAGQHLDALLSGLTQRLAEYHEVTDAAQEVIAEQDQLAREIPTLISSCRMTLSGISVLVDWLDQRVGRPVDAEAEHRRHDDNVVAFPRPAPPRDGGAS